MFCQKCGAPISDGSKFCSSCGKKCQNTKSPLIPILLAVIGGLLVVIAVILCVQIALFSGTKEVTSISEPMPSVSISVEASTEEKNEITEEKTGIQFTPATEKPKYDSKSDALQLPSLESFSEDRMIAGTVEEVPSAGGYSVIFSAGSDTNIVECLSEYCDYISSKYSLSECGSTSYMDKKGYNCLYRAFTITEATGVNLDSISVTLNNNQVDCNICIIKAVKDGDAYIKIYMPENVTFFYDEEIHKVNGY